MNNTRIAEQEARVGEKVDPDETADDVVGDKPAVGHLADARDKRHDHANGL